MALDDGNSELLPILPDREHQAAGVTGQDPDDGPIGGDHCIRNYGAWQPLDGKACTPERLLAATLAAEAMDPANWVDSCLVPLAHSSMH